MKEIAITTLVETDNESPVCYDFNMYLQVFQGVKF